MTQIKRLGGVPALFINGKPVPAAAYMTYLPERGRYADFAAAGYDLYSLPVFFAGKAISATAGVRPFGPGIFDGETPDYSSFDANVRAVLAVSPGAYVLPRVNVSLPDRWLAAHPDCLDATGKHESLFSEQAMVRAGTLLRAFLSHVQKSDYADRVIGYHLAGGCTEEWFHFDMDSPDVCKAAKQGFRRYLAQTRPEQAELPPPDFAALGTPGPRHGAEATALFLEYTSAAVVSYITHLAGITKKAAPGAAVGVFYGYTLEVTSSRYGTHALSKLLQCPDIDFISSPNSYIGVRDPAADWTEMYPAASVRLHGKLCVQECDVRTHLTRPLSQCAPAYDPAGALTAPIWQPLPDKNAAVQQIRKSFCRQLIGGNGFWWFDMWGGWYADDALMAEMALYRQICAAALQKKNRAGVSELAVFTDERAYYELADCPLRGCAHEQRRALGLTGAPYDAYDISDFAAVYQNYKAVLFITGIETSGLRTARALCEKTNVPYLCNSERQPTFGTEVLRAFLRQSGVHIYCETDDILYVNENHIALHAVEAGVKTLRFRTAVALAPLLGGKPACRGSTVKIPMEKNETALFEIRTER